MCERRGENRAKSKMVLVRDDIQGGRGERREEKKKKRNKDNIIMAQ